MRKIIWVLLIFMLCLLIGITVCGQDEVDAADDDFPNRPIYIVVGFNPGGGMDLMSRIVAPHMSKYLGTEVIIINMVGAQSAVAFNFVYNQPADGYTILAVPGSSGTFPASGLTDLTYHDFRMVGISNASGTVIQVPMKSPYETMEDLMQAIKEGGTKAGNDGMGGAHHMPQIVMVDSLGGQVDYIPYEGGKPVALAVARGELDWGCANFIEGLEFFQQGLSRPLAGFRTEEIVSPDYDRVIPPITDYMPEIEDLIDPASSWAGLAVKNEVPENRYQKILEAYEYGIASDDFKKYVKNSFGMLRGIMGDDAQAIYERTMRVQSWIMYDLGIGKRSPEEVNVPRP